MPGAPAEIQTDYQFISVKIHHCGVPFDTNYFNNNPAAGLARLNVNARFYHPWYMHTGGNMLINSEVYQSAGTGLTPDGDSNIVTGNYIHDNAVQGILIAGGRNWTVSNNVFYNNGGIEIYLRDGQGHNVRNNTVVAGPRYTDGINPMSWGIFLSDNAGASLMENNIISGFKYGIWNQTFATASTARNNLINSLLSDRELYDAYNGVTPIVRQNNTFNIDPMLGLDFAPLPGSPVIGKGTDGKNIGAK
jgi:parallel beta-helix repeat protein